MASRIVQYLKLKKLPDKKKKFYKKIITLLGYIPGDFQLYESALIHKSASLHKEGGKIINNERLEYLGDAVLDTIIAEYLYEKFPKKGEGFLTQLRAKIVKREQLNLLAKKMGLHKIIISNTNLSDNKHIFGNTLEAFIGAIFIDKGYKKTNKYVIKQIIEKHLNLQNLKNTESDFKSRLIEWSQKNKEEIFIKSNEVGEGACLSFAATVKYQQEIIGEGKGRSKKEAEQIACKYALKAIRNL